MLHHNPRPDRHTVYRLWNRYLYRNRNSLHRQSEISGHLLTLAEDVLPQLVEMTNASAAMDRVRWDEQYILNGDTAEREEETAFCIQFIAYGIDIFIEIGTRYTAVIIGGYFF